MTGGRVTAEHPSGFVVIRPAIAPDVVPFECQHCGLMMRQPSDPGCHLKHGCCSRCVTRWVDANRVRWSDGWRPPREEVEEQAALWRL